MMDAFGLLARKQRASNAIDQGLPTIKVSPQDQFQLIQELEELRAALREFVLAWDDYGTEAGERLTKAVAKARAALGEK